MRAGERMLHPSPGLKLEAGDTLVLFGTPDSLGKAEASLLARVASTEPESAPMREDTQ